MAICPYRVETGPVLTQAFQGFLGQTSVIQFGKTRPTARVENGGISGVVYYSATRAEDDPEIGGPEPWEPGIPGVTVNLYATGADARLSTRDVDCCDDHHHRQLGRQLPTDCPGDNDLVDARCR